ncbi:ABC transporter permease [Pseudarthrobacter sp. NS4]|uniref:ABC transporter permease n=1 Tax=Pseudarthrobacter sp. NS4 TaxID=2973976 RepID=UPI0021622763|nr:ABC transporter permease [Pseudarthrobacter sp. NS4]
MTTYILRRLGTGLLLAMLVTLITFFLLSLSFDAVVRARLGSVATPESVAAMTAELGFDRPVLVQYFEWLGGVLRGDFGTSLFTSEPVGPAVASRLAVTLSIVLVALAITVLISVTLGVVAATRGGLVDRLAQAASLVGYIIPGLLIAIVLVVVFAINLRMLPATGYTPFDVNPGRWAATITIPVIVLVIGGAANITAQVRGTMIDELRKDYVRTLRTRGISTRSIVLKHALRNAAGPALTVLSFEFIAMLGGALIIEKVFALPGFGTFAFNSSLQGDITVIMGITLFSVLLVVCINLLVDLVNGWLNPKARIF